MAINEKLRRKVQRRLRDQAKYGREALPVLAALRRLRRWALGKIDAATSCAAVETHNRFVDVIDREIERAKGGKRGGRGA